MGTAGEIESDPCSPSPGKEDDLGFLVMAVIAASIGLGLWVMIIRVVLKAWGQIL